MDGGEGHGLEHASTTEQAVSAAIAENAHLAGALLPILHALQDRLGYVPESSVPQVADALNLSRAEVHGVLTFYHWFRVHKPGRHVIHLCRAEACQALGARAVESRMKQALGCDFHGTTADGAVTLEPVYCLGHCARGPAALVDGEPVAALTPAAVDALVESLRGKP
jgi:formate dehydrogenase subunit gamma